MVASVDAAGERRRGSRETAFVRLTRFGLDVAAAIDEPRMHAQWMPDLMLFERFIPRDVVEDLQKRGQHPKLDIDYAAVHAVRVGAETVTAASDPRYGGAPAAP